MKYILDAGEMQTREETHDYLKEMFGFPEHYGKNLDALYDCLSDMEDTEVEIQNLTEETIFLLRIVNVMRAAGVSVKIV